MNFLINFLKGVAISISQIIPGVSGGTIAIILGIYDKLLHAVNNIIADFKNQYKILLQVGLGAVVGIFLFSNIVKTVLTNFPTPTSYFFIGVILGGAPLMYIKAKENGFEKRNLIYLIIGIVAVLLMTGEHKDSSIAITSLNLLNFIWLFIGGIIVAIALILPGISGSFMLLVLGLYNTVITAVTELNIIILIPIALGGIFGTLATARIIENLLSKYPQQTYMMILGFVLGSVFGIFPAYEGVGSTIIGIVLAVIGFLAIYYMSKKDMSKKEYTE